MGRLEIIEYKKQDLKGLLGDGNFWQQPRLPITKRRVISQLSNTRADDSDTVLITASNNGRVIGFLGLMPDLVLGQGGARTKFGWLSAWWVDKEAANRLAATIVLVAAMKKYPNRLAVSSPSEEAVRVYEATGHFYQCTKFERVGFILAAPPSFRGLGPMTRWVAWARNALVFDRAHQRRGVEIQIVDSLNESLAAYIDKWAAGDPLLRNCAYWRWVLSFPWVSTSAEDEAAQKTYPFSVYAQDFKQIPMVVTRRGSIVSFLFLTLRDGRLSLKYAYYDPCDIVDITAALRSVISRINPYWFASADAGLNASLRKGFPFYLATRCRSLGIYASKGLPLAIGSPPQFGTGEMVFT